MEQRKNKIAVVAIIFALAIAGMIALGLKGYGPFSNKTQPAVVKVPEAGHEHDVKVQKKVLYTCPMHPQYISDRPGQCPICGMDLVKVEKEEAESPKATGEAAMSDMPKGFGMVKLPGEKVQMIGIRTAPATRATLTRTIRATATVAVDERRVKQMQAKVEGWIDKLYVNYTGQYVKKGQPLLAIYSPDLVSAQEEYLLALRNKNSLRDAMPEIRDGAENMVEAARRRLRYWDVTSAQINRLEETGEPTKNVILYSPVQGYVTETKSMQGMQVEPGIALFTITDLSNVWVLVGIYEQDFALVKKGMEVIFRTDTYPGKEFSGKVTYINPILDPQNRTATIRVELPNPDMILRPGTFGNATLMQEIPDVLTVPASAVMDSGERKIVYVQTEPGHFMPREVKVGNRTDDLVEITDGLKEGELVVIDGNFMLDSESRLRASSGNSQSGDMESMPGMNH